jgi:hypothetical protein
MLHSKVHDRPCIHKCHPIPKVHRRAHEKNQKAVRVPTMQATLTGVYQNIELPSPVREILAAAIVPAHPP